ncbi:MAG: hypothetical protein FWC92_01570 [Defluviitaleaceae bacterium]|nr:hypothetical protein [Defluviitaleaceae bacterium]
MDTPQDITAINLRQERNLLFDFYGPALTSKQAACFTMRYLEDCSLTEIAQELDISPQAVVDFIKRSVMRLEKYEMQLGLVQKFAAQQALAQDILAKLDELEQQLTPEAPAKALTGWIKNAVGEMLV